jgi:3-hydroxy-3-methylglutaryl CoA synthase
MKTGIDALSFDIAKLHLPIKLLLNFAILLKIENGLGLLKMTLPDLHQDAVVLGQCLNQTNYRTRYQTERYRSHLCRDRKQH